MKYHHKEKIYILSEEEMKNSDKHYYYDPEVKNYYWILEIIKETKPNFFEVSESDYDFCQALGYIGDNDVRELLDFLEFKYRISCNIGYYKGFVIGGNNSDLLESKIVINNVELSNFLSITVYNIDERSKYILMKETLNSMLCFFRLDEEILGPSREIFIHNIENDRR